ncbi:DUF1848 domain-containing protein [Flavonifractor plautii]|nr:DUF1848 domain-containing protein [Flavonifractor plautii]
MLWRYDPILFTDAIGLAWHEARFRKLCKALSPFTDQVTVSFLDPYPGRPMGGLRPQMPWKCRSWRPCWGKLQRNITCQLWPAARRGLLPHGIGRAACIDRSRLERLCGGPLRLGPDRGQRPGCGCCESVDIGAYDTCPSGCRYCYANRSPARTAARRAEHVPDSPLLTGVPGPGDTVTGLPACSCRDGQLRLF